TQEAIRTSKQAIRIKPDLAEAHHNLGMAYSKLGLYQEAVEASKQAVRFKPNYAEAHCILCVSYLLLGNRGSALQEYQVLKDLDEHFASMLDDLLKKDENDRAKHAVAAAKPVQERQPANLAEATLERAISSVYPALVQVY